MKRFAAVSVLLVLLAAQAAFCAETSGKRLNLDLKDVPFPEVIRQIFSGSKYSYSVDPALNNLKVSATLKNVTLDQAIRVVSKTAAVIYSVDTSNTYVFKPDPQVVSIQRGSVQSPGLVAPRGPVGIDLITLQYISAGDAASLLNASPPDGLVSITATSVNTLMLKGDAEAIDQAQKLIKLFDVEAALPRSVRVTLSLKVSAAGLKDPIILTTESVGPEGGPMPLNINSSSEQTDSYMLDATLTPTVLSDGSISLTGSGGIDCNLSGVGPNAQRMSKLFEVAASAASGTPTIIASGSAERGAGKVEFAVSATVTVEKGRVVMPKGGLSPPGAGGAVPAKTPRSTPQSAGAANKPDEAHRRAADALLQQIWRAEPGQPKFDAIDAVVRKYKEGDMATRNAIAWLCVTYMKDKSRGVLDRWPCCYVVSRSGYEQGVPDLIDVLLHDGVEVMRAVAAEALGGLPNSAAAHDALVQAELGETSQRVRDVIAKYLGKDTR